MIYEIKFDSHIEKIIKKWKKSNPLQYKKLIQLIKDIQEHPRSGLGHPEPLIGGDGITYSRRISAHDRIVYRIYDDVVVVLVIELGGHYSDK